MKIWLTLITLILTTSITYADYTVKNVYRFDNIDMIKNADGSNVLNLTVNGVSEDSNGNKATSKCLVNVLDGIISGNCEAVDQDGDIEYSKVERNINKGNVGELKRIGGTGKYANKSSTCEYTVELTDFKIGVGYLTASCKE
tara:strand:+ start:33182 stop:33607 length:426 start_codon:yes stop_codon:yes gene_type:complete